MIGAGDSFFSAVKKDGAALAVQVVRACVLCVLFVALWCGAVRCVAAVELAGRGECVAAR